MTSENSKYNIIVIGVSCFDGMASSTRMRNLLNPLIEKKRVDVSNLVFIKDSSGLTQKKGTLNAINYEVIGFRRSNPLSVFTFFWQGLNFIHQRKSRGAKNIIYNYDHPDVRTILFLMYAKLNGFKIVIDIVEDNRFTSTKTRLLTRIKIKSSLLFTKRPDYIADAVIAISHHLYDVMNTASKGNIPIHLIPITVDLKKFPQKPYHIPQHFKIFYGGSFGKKDGLHYLIKAFEIISQKYPNVDLILTGRGSPEDMKPINELIKNFPFKERLHFKGYLSIDEYYKTLNDCDIFCMTRIDSKFANAGFPFKLGEFLSTGKAVIATDVGDVSQFLQNNENALLIHPCSLDELVNSISSILENPEKIVCLGNKARKTAEEYFDTEKVSLRVMEIFQKI